MANGYVFTNDAIVIMKDQFINETRKALAEYDPADQNAQAVISAIGGMMILMDSAINALDSEDNESKEQ